MRRFVLCLTALAALVGAFSPTTALAAERRQAASGLKQEPGQPPHAWLFGTWTGGLFPPLTGISAEACLAQPVVIFTRDVVLRATITDQFYIQRLIETALTTTNGIQFHFTAAVPPMMVGGLTGGSSGTPAAAGFGCANPDVLDVERRGNNQIVFSNCADFPYPLVRCPSG